MSLKQEFNENIKLEMKEELKVQSVLAVPYMEKIVINMGIGKNKDNKQFIAEALLDMGTIAGQKPIEKKSRVSISNFKLRRGQVIGVSVTLRGEKMWAFYEKLVKIVLPRVKDFRGVTKKSFDGYGNYNLGLRDLLVFPEIDANKNAFNKPLQITIKTTARNNEDGYLLLKKLGMPFND